MRKIRNSFLNIRGLFPLTLILLALIYCFHPSHGFAFDRDWDSGHNTTGLQSPDPAGPPDDDTGGDQDPDEDNDDDNDEDEDPDEDEDDDDEEDEDDDCKEDCNNECKPDAKKSPVYVKSGNLELKYIDFEIGGIGPPLRVTRTYNSHDSYEGPFGHGWVFNLASRLVKVSDHANDYVIIRKASGKRLRFIKNIDGSYSPSASSVTDTLVEQPDGSFTLNCRTCSRTFLRPVYHFDDRGRLSSIADNYDNFLLFSYDTKDRLVLVDSSATGRSIAVSYNSNDKIAQIRDSLGRSWYYTYDIENNLASVTDPLGYSLMYEYNSKHKLLSVTDKNGNISPAITYDENLRVKTYGTGGEIYTYNYLSGYTTKTDSLGNIFTFYYDLNGNVIKTILPDGSEVLTYISDRVNPTRRVDANGNEWRYTYDEFGQILTATDPLGNTTNYTYDSRFHKIKSKIDPNGGVWTYTYDDTGNLVKLVDPLMCETTMTYNPKGRMASRTDGAGNRVAFYYDMAGNLIKEVDPQGHEIKSTFDALGRLLSKTDARGNTWFYTYDLLGRLMDAKDPAGNHKLYTYDGNGNRLTVTDENGNTTTFTYDMFDRMISKSDPLGNKTEYTYDVAGNLLTVTDPMGNQSLRVYDERYMVTSETDPAGNVTEYTYDASGNRLTKKDAREKVWTYTYDAMDRILTETDPLDNKTIYEYDAMGNRTKVKDPDGLITYFTYDLMGRLTRSLIKVGDDLATPDEDDIVTTYEYDCLGRRVTEIDALGQKRTWTYDFRGKTLTEKNSLNEIKTYTYDANGNKLTHTTVTGNVISYTYDRLNRMTAAGDTIGGFESYEYDAVGNKTKTIKVNGDTVQTVYTVFNKPARITDGMGNYSTYSYDKNYNLVQVTDRLGKMTINAYDSLNRLYKVTDSLGNVSTLNFDPAGNMVKMTDANKGETVYAYDDANRLISMTYADGTSKAVVYSPAGKIISKTDQNGTVIEYERDDLARITRRTYPDTSSYAYTYDKLGRLLTAVNAYGTIAFSYDAAGRITAIDQNGTKIHYAHDVSQRTRTTEYPMGKKFTEFYTLRDKIARVDDVSDPDNTVTRVTYTYDALGRPLTKTFANGVTTGYTYNKNSRITGLSHSTSNGTDLLGFQYLYDKEENRSHTLDTVHTDQSEQYVYDDAQRLTGFKQGEVDASNQIPVPRFTSEYELDALGSWSTVTRDGQVESRSINSLSQYTLVGTVPQTYDSNGNLIDDGTYVYTYDYENQLTRITRKSDDTTMASFTIDALNRRVAKTVGPVTTEYIYDDSRIIEERVNNAATAFYLYGNKLDEVILMGRGNVLSYFHRDVIGSVVALTDTSGAPVESYTYDPYGRVSVFNGAGTRITSSAKGNPYLFTGRRYDTEAGLYYYRARCYSPDLGRFLNPDPKGFVDGMNLYEYAMSNPLRYIDPRGTSVKECSGSAFSFDAGLIKKYLPGFIGKYMENAEISGSYQKCRECCGEGTLHAGEYTTNKELNFAVGWSGDSGYIPSPWGVAWDVDVWLFQSKGFIGLVARVSWGISGNLSGGTDNCDDKLAGKGCIKGNLALEALFGVAEEDEDTGWIKAYVSGGVTGSVDLCLVVQRANIRIEASAGISGAIKGTVGVWKYTYEKTFYEVSTSTSPWVIYKF